MPIQSFQENASVPAVVAAVSPLDPADLLDLQELSKRTPRQAVVYSRMAAQARNTWLHTCLQTGSSSSLLMAWS